MEKEPTIKDVMNIVQEQSVKTDQSFTELHQVINKFADSVEDRFNKIESEIGSMQSDIGSMRALMVTKDYLDDKMADLRGDLVVLTRKEDTKAMAVVKKLEEKKIFTKKEADEIYQMEPFPALKLKS